MEAFVSDDEGFFLFKNIKFKVHEHITELLAATHSKRAHPVAWLPMSYCEREREIQFSLSYACLHVLHIVRQRDGELYSVQ